MVLYNGRKILAVLEEIVAELGEDFIYETPLIKALDPETGEEVKEYPDGCLYVDPETGAGSCIVGRFVEKIGLPLTDLAVLDLTPTEVTNPLFAMWAETVDLKISKRGMEVLRVAQWRQDKGSSYGLVLEGARNAVKNGNE